jgi:hypothetical protein
MEGFTSYFPQRTPGIAAAKGKRRGGSPVGAQGKETHLTKGLEGWGGKEKNMVIGLYTGREIDCAEEHWN